MADQKRFNSDPDFTFLFLKVNFFFLGGGFEKLALKEIIIYVISLRVSPHVFDIRILESRFE